MRKFFAKKIFGLSNEETYKLEVRTLTKTPLLMKILLKETSILLLLDIRIVRELNP